MESTRSAPDTITDFAPATDKINLSAIDANSRKAGNQAFAYRGGKAFSKKAGQLRFAKGKLMGDVNGDGRADIVIKLSKVKKAPAKGSIVR